MDPTQQKAVITIELQNKARETLELRNAQVVAPLLRQLQTGRSVALWINSTGINTEIPEVVGLAQNEGLNLPPDRIAAFARAYIQRRIHRSQWLIPLSLSLGFICAIVCYSVGRRTRRTPSQGSNV